MSAARVLLVLGGSSALLAVVLGALAAHGLKARLAPEALATFEVGVRYQMYHALALIATGLVHAIRPLKTIAVSGALFALGTVLFSGSLYVLVLGGVRTFAMATPFGGVAFLAGWLCFVWGVWRA